MPVSPASRLLPCRVIKVGGSLLQFEGLVPAFREWHDAQPPAIDVLMAGGGDLVEAVRDLNQRFAMDQLATHWLCVRLLDVTARILHLLLPEAAFLDRCEELRARLSAAQPSLILFSVEEFLQRYEPTMAGHRLPTNWSSTSDSIAARLAQAIGADELVLLKSAVLSPPANRSTAAQAGYVDAFFPSASLPLQHVRCVDLRKGEQLLLPQ